MKYYRSILLALLIATATVAGAKARYVFYFIGDGMGMGHVNATQYYNRMVLGNEEPLLMMQFPVASHAWTYSASSPVTDSAAAGTALSTGFKTNNYMIAMSPDSTTHYKSIARTLKDEGWGVGILTSVAPDDATPAAFYANRLDRGMHAGIDEDAIKSGYEFMGGASLRGLKDSEGHPNAAAEMLKKSGIKILYGTDGYENTDAERLIILSPEGVWGNNNDIGYTIDSIPGALTLPELTRAGLAQVSRRSPDRFFMMIEGGNIDHAAHANDPGGVIKEILNFQDAIKIAYDFYLQHPDETLIVVTADHDTGGMALSRKTKGGLGLIDNQRISKDLLTDYCRNLLENNTPVTWEEMKSMLSDKLGLWGAIPLDEKTTESLHNTFNRTFIERTALSEKALYNVYNAFVVEIFKIYNKQVGTAFINSSHTANPVPVFAIGAGADKFTGVNNNTDIPKLIYEATR
ncbi:MAG TPA: alkaline phosphatase [Muribaculum sp.]|jgi:alkaline phosphatase|uniref:Alkaline phosphatase n=1 Tax=Heminiphilus faecis TaxID=2601703 RepID=A0ABV4CV97_9BACT|nr:alkaline phosphatase [Heminiphilus faecis]RLT77468.1 alkaline phosphatase [bacterium J10(2018)]HRF67803.1 alkaline phosphatase [Muribaculum sp.]